MKLTADIQNQSLRKILSSLGFVLVCCVYAVLWGLLWELSLAFWYLPAGLRFAVLMYTRMKYWPAWFLGEWMALSYLNATYTDHSSILESGLANVMPLMIYAIAITFLLRKKAWSPRPPSSQKIVASTTVAIIIAAMLTALSLVLFLPDDSPFLLFERFSLAGIFTYALGDMAGVLFFWSSVEFIRFFRILGKSGRRAFVLDAFYLMVPLTALVVVLVPVFDWTFLAVLFLPIVILSLRHGWAGATFSLMALNIVAGVSLWLTWNTGVLFDAQIFLVSIGFTGLFLGAAISHKEELITSIRDISKRVIETQEAERNRISQDLHDHVGQVLTALRSRLAILGRKATNDLADEIDKLDQIAARAYLEVHDIVSELSPRELAHFGLKRSLESSTFYDMLHAANIDYATSIDQQADKISKQLQMAVFRISQEALTNVCKHSLASECSLEIVVFGKKVQEMINLQIQDNGVGFDIETISGGHGLQNIEDRVQALSGSYYLKSGEKGTLLDITFPL
jgi:glucose-6-phosphate-specific signal transduction histidine kinase